VNILSFLRPNPGHGDGTAPQRKKSHRFACNFQLLGSFVVLVGALAWLGQTARGDDAARNARLRERLSSGVLKWGADAEGGAPYVLLDPEDPDKLIGFEIEIAAELAKIMSAKLGIPLKDEFTQYDWGSLPSGLRKGDFDLILNGMEITPNNRRVMLFSRPYYVYAQQLVVRNDDHRIKNFQECIDEQFTVGTLGGTAAEKLMKDAGLENVKGYDGQMQPYSDLELGRIDAVLLDVPIAVFCAGTNTRLKFVGDRLGQGFYGIACRLDDADLMSLVDEALSEMMVSGKLRDIYLKWHLWNRDQNGLASGPQKTEELAGLGFNADGVPLPGLEEAEGGVDAGISDAASNRWTITQYLPDLLQAAAMTVFLTFSSMAVAMTVGLLVAVARLYGPTPVKWLALIYVEFFRGTPLLLLLTVVYYGLPFAAIAIIGQPLALTGIQAAIICFGLNYAAYEAEIYRSAIQSIPVGQWEAASALGMSWRTSFRRIIFPQAFRTALGPMTNDFVALFKDTSLVSVIAVYELTKAYSVLARNSHRYMELGLLTVTLYLLMSVPLGYLSRQLEKRFGPQNK